MGSPIIFSGNFAKLLKDSLDFFGGAQALSKNVDPTVTATAGRKGSVLFSTLTGQHYRKLDAGSSTNWEPLTAGGLWARQYVKNFRGDTGTTGYATYDDGASSRPVDGTGGSPSAVTISTTGTNPLSGVTSMLLSKSAADGQGEGVSYDIAIDRADRGKVMRLALKYEIASGTYSGGTSTTDSDVIAYLYRVDSTARLIEPVPFKLNGGVVGQQYELNAEFQTDTDATNYRLMLHVATTSASAYTIKFEWQLSTVLASSGPVVQGWQQFTATGNWTTNATYTGFYRQIGDSAEIAIGISLSGAPGGTSTLVVNLPSGLAIDTAKLNGTTENQSISSGGSIYDSSAGSSTPVYVEYSTTTSVAVRYGDDTAGFVQSRLSVDANNPWTFASGDKVFIRFVVPISGWGSGQVSAGANARTLASDSSLDGTNQTLSNNTDTKINITVNRFDTGGMVDLSNDRITAIVAGKYFFFGGIGYQANATGTRMAEIRRNGVDNQANKHTAYYVPSSSGKTSAFIGGPFELNAGEYVELWGNQNSGGNLDVNGNPNETYLSCFRVGGPEQIVASEKVYLDAYRSSNQSINDSTQTTIVIDTIVSDSHQALNTSTGVWTAPRADFYTITGKLRFAANAVGTRSIRVRKNGSTSIMELQIQTHPTGITTISDTRSVYLLQGETIELRALQDSGGSLNVNGGSADTYLTISGQ